jgi:hypothetical protein
MDSLTYARKHVPSTHTEEENLHFLNLNGAYVQWWLLSVSCCMHMPTFVALSRDLVISPLFASFHCTSFSDRMLNNTSVFTQLLLFVSSST